MEKFSPHEQEQDQEQPAAEKGMEKFSPYEQEQDQEQPASGKKEEGEETEPDIDKTGAMERKYEEKEVENFEDRYQRMVREKYEIKREREKTHSLAFMLQEGVQTLIDEYGGESVFDAMETILQDDREKKHGKPRTTILHLVKTLVPNKKERAALYEKMEGDIDLIAERFEEEQFERPRKEGEKGPYGYFEFMWGSGGNFKRGAVNHKIHTLKRLNTFLRSSPTTHEYKELAEGGTSHFVYYLQNEDEREELKKELKESGNDLIHMMEERDKKNREREDRLLSEKDRFVDEISAEMQRITNELDTELDEYRTRLISDLNKVKGLELASEGVREALQAALQAAESDFMTRTEATKKEAEKRTTPLRNLMYSVKNMI